MEAETESPNECKLPDPWFEDYINEHVMKIMEDNHAEKRLKMVSITH